MTKQENVSIQHHPLNYEESIALRDEMGDVLVSKECYSNVFHAILYSGGKFTSGEWKVAYGYIQVLENTPIMGRHCFIVNSKGEAIDPTLMNVTGFKAGEERGHISFKVFEDLETYLDAVTDNDNVPDLVRPLRKLEHEICQPWAHSNSVALIG